MNLDFIYCDVERQELLDNVNYFFNKGGFNSYEECLSHYVELKREEIAYRDNFYKEEDEEPYVISEGKKSYLQVKSMFMNDFLKYIPREEVENVNKVLNKSGFKDSLLENNNIVARLGNLEVNDYLIELIRLSENDLSLIKNLLLFKYKNEEYHNFISVLILDIHSYVVDEVLSDLEDKPFGDVLCFINKIGK